MIGALIGDIVGSRYERVSHKSKQFKLFDKICRPTDDSVMSLAIAKAILESEDGFGDLSRKAIDVMQELGRIYKNAGYGGTFFKWIWAEDPQPYNSFGNGSAMRVGPCGFAAANLEEAKALSTEVTKVSHDHPEGMKGAEATASVIWAARNHWSKPQIRKYVEKEFYPLKNTCDQIRPGYHFDVSCQGTVPQAITAFLEGESFEDVIRTAVSLGGDCDTLTCIAGGMAEAFYGVPEELKAECRKRIEPDMRKVLDRFEDYRQKQQNK